MNQFKIKGLQEFFIWVRTLIHHTLKFTFQCRSDEVHWNVPVGVVIEMEHMLDLDPYSISVYQLIFMQLLLIVQNQILLFYLEVLKDLFERISANAILVLIYCVYKH